MSVAAHNDKIEAKADPVALEDAKTPINEHMPEILRSYSPEQLRTMEKSLVRKIDLRSLPILCILFLLNILDRNAIANARLGGLERSLKIDDVQYQTAVMVLWGSYLLCWRTAQVKQQPLPMLTYYQPVISP